MSLETECNGASFESRFYELPTLESLVLLRRNCVCGFFASAILVPLFAAMVSFFVAKASVTAAIALLFIFGILAFIGCIYFAVECIVVDVRLGDVEPTEPGALKLLYDRLSGDHELRALLCSRLCAQGYITKLEEEFLREEQTRRLGVDADRAVFALCDADNASA